MPNRSPARILRDVKRITKFLPRKMSRPYLSMISLNGRDIPPNFQSNLGLAKIVTMDFPPTQNLSSKSIIENLQKENERLKYDLNVLKFILQSYKQDEGGEPVDQDESEDARNETYECNFCYFETETFEEMKRHRRNFHNAIDSA
jgi:hypothetical protein